MEKRALFLSVCITFIAAACSDTGDTAATSDKAAEMASLHEREYARMRSAFCPTPPGQEAQGAIPTSGDLSVEPTKIFDNLYFVGNKASSSWALTTPEGIILFDAGFHYSVKETIVDGLEKLGLDPHDIKYVIVSHGHNDHFGGANYLQKTYGARIVMSEADWVHMVTWPQKGSPAPYPDKDIVVNDGDEITLGGTTVRIVVTPGHTPGTVSPVFPVKEGGETHMVGYWGGDGAGYLPPDEMQTYIDSAARFTDLDPAVDIELSNHAAADGTLLKLPLLKARRPGDPNPFISDHAQFREWVGVLKSCAEEYLAQKKSS